MSGGIRRGHRDHVSPGQEPRKRRASRPRATDEEWAKIVAAAARDGKAPVAWLMDVGVKIAGLRAQDLDWARLEALQTEVKLLHQGLARIGHNVNQIAARLNATGEIGAGATATLGAVQQRMTRLDGLVTEIAAVLS
jgi:hypothetical protein